MSDLDAHHTRVAFLDALSRPELRRFLDSYAASVTGAKRDGTAPGMLPGDAADGTGLATHLRSAARMSHAYYVAPTMQAVVTAAAESMPEDAVVNVQDFPTDAGWLYIPGGGITVLDIRGKIVTTNVILWTRHGAHVDVTLLADTANPSDTMRIKAAAEGRTIAADLRITPWHHTVLTIGEPVPTSITSGMVVPPEEADLFRFIPGPDGTVAFHHPRGFSPEDMQFRARPDQHVQWLLACLRIMQQPLADVTTTGLPASVRKAMPHAVRIKDTRVTVINYRRREGEHGDGSGREFSHRFLRRGHWRRQWVGSAKDGSRRQELTWVHPHLVGPEDAPLLVREHVRSLRR